MPTHCLDSKAAFCRLTNTDDKVVIRNIIFLKSRPYTNPFRQIDDLSGLDNIIRDDLSGLENI